MNGISLNPDIYGHFFFERQCWSLSGIFGRNPLMEMLYYCRNGRKYHPKERIYSDIYNDDICCFFPKSFAFLSFHSIIQSTLYYKFTNMEKSQISQEEALKTIEEIRRDISPSWGKRRFFRHLIIYILVISFLWFLNLRGESDQTGFWAIYPTIGWGIAVMIHFIRTTF